MLVSPISRNLLHSRRSPASSSFFHSCRAVRVRRFQSMSKQDILQYVIVGLLTGCFWWQRGGHDTLAASSDTLGRCLLLIHPSRTSCLLDTVFKLWYDLNAGLPAGARESTFLGAPELYLSCLLSMLWTCGPVISNGIIPSQHELHT